MKSIIFIATDSITQSQYANLELDYLQRSGYDIQICIYCKKEEYSTFDATSNPEYTNKSFLIYHSFSKFERYIKKHCKDSVFLLSTSQSAAIWYILSQYKCQYIAIGPRTGHPVAHDLTPNWKTPRWIKPKNLFYRVIHLLPHPVFLFQLFLSKINNIKRDKLNKLNSSDLINSHPPDFILVDTQYDFDYYLDDCFKNKKIVFVPSIDYNRFLHQTRMNPQCTEEFLLYVHSGVLFNMRGFADRDRLLSAFSDIDVRKKYTQNLEKLFDKMEKHYNLPVIIAAHPNVNFKGYTFGNRKIVYGNTCELVQKCAMYIGPASTAASFAVLFNKRLLIIYCDAEKKSEDLRYQEYYEPLLQELQLPGGNLDDDSFMLSPWDYAPYITEETRKAYIKKYLCDPSSNPDKTYGEILRELIDSL